MELESKITDIIEKVWTNLVATTNSQEKFNKEFLRFAPDLRKYIDARLRTSVSKEQLHANEYKVDDFLDELYLKAYENIKRFDTAEGYYIWMIQQLDMLLDDATTEEEFNDIFFKNIDDYTQQEWESMQENFTKDAGGDIVMLEDLDDNSYSKYQYQLQDVFVDDSSQKMIEELSDKLNEEEIHHHIDLIINNLPLNERVIFQQSVLLGSTIPEVARINKAKENEIEEKLKAIRMTIQKSFVIRYNTK